MKNNSDNFRGFINTRCYEKNQAKGIEVVVLTALDENNSSAQVMKILMIFLIKVM